ncbi:MAG: hypothetical protein IKK65_00935 [Clostridia bacterium]|nr:hypothetical protein [Clostridia bacterium]
MKAKYNIIAFLFIGVLGAVSHFVYEWSGENKILGYFFAVNESTWEHLKLLFFPTIIFSVIEYFFVKKEINNYVISVAVSVVVGMLSIIVLFNTYTGFLGYSIDFLNILIYYIALVIMLIIKNKIIVNGKFSGQNSSLFGMLICFIITLFFIFFTYNPPSLAVFTPPIL